MYPALEGTNITFSCPPGLILTGPNTSTCMRNGNWEPNPQRVKCLGEITLLCSLQSQLHDICAELKGT